MFRFFILIACLFVLPLIFKDLHFGKIHDSNSEKTDEKYSSMINDNKNISDNAETLYNKIFTENVPPQHIENLKNDAENGDDYSLIELGIRYLDGIGVPQSTEEGISNIQKAVSHNNSMAKFVMGKLFENGIGVDKSHAKALEYYLQASELGHSEAKCHLGHFYEKGIAVEQSYEKAAEFYKYAAQGGNLDAHFFLGRLLTEGLGVGKDVLAGIKLYTIAAEKNHTPSLMTLGFLYEKGKFVEQSYEKAFNYYKSAANKNCPEAFFRLGFFYEKGLFVKLSLSDALENYEKGASLENSDSQLALGYMYEFGIEVKKSLKTAAMYYKKSADQGNCGAQENIANLYSNGKGVEQSYENAKYYYLLAEKQGSSIASCALGKYAELGIGEEVSYEKAKKYYKKAIEKRLPVAYFHLGLMYHRGLLDQSYSKAFLLYKKGAELGDAACQYHLGYLYEKGYGVEKNLSLAIDYYRKSEKSEFVPPTNDDLNNFYRIDNNGNQPFLEQIENLKVPHFVKKIAKEKYNDMMSRPESADALKIKKWLSSFLKIPFGKIVNDTLPNIYDTENVEKYFAKVKKNLDNAVYGHEKAKRLLVEMVGQWVRKGYVNGGVIGIQGPPGTGKTALATKGLSKALGRPFVFISLGGKHDGTFLIGCDEAYISSHHGKIVESLIESECMNPIFYFDEVDKLSGNSANEIASIITHLTDPVQNMYFQDQYFRDINFDLSKAIFVFSYNDEGAIPKVLRDRMTIIRTQGPSIEEKIVIARDYILPEVLETVGFSNKNISIDDDTLKFVIENYTREVGVRKLKEQLMALLRRINIDSLLNSMDIDDYELSIDIVKSILDSIDEPEKDVDVEEYYNYLLEKLDVNAINKQKIVRKIAESKAETHSSNEARRWLDCFFKVPIGEYLEGSFPDKNDKDGIKKYLKNVRKSLDDAVYGHEKTKETLVGAIGEWISKGNKKGLVIGLQGPPGNGKTSLALKGISKAFNLPIGFISLGGGSHGSYLIGHDEGFVGSHCGQIVEKLIETKCMNPIIYFDELDKVSKSSYGQEIVGALTHLTDSSQNHKFHDNYLQGIDLDLSKAVIVFSYNDPRAIDPILRDRMTVVKTEELSLREKVIIAKEYIIPELVEEFAFDKDDIVITDDNIKYIIENYTYESGVRGLKKCMIKIFREINLSKLAAENFSLPITLTNDLIKTLVKMDSIYVENKFLEPEIGVVNGLYASFIGPGGVFQIQVSKNFAKQHLELLATGNLKKVIKESVQVAKTVAWNILSESEKNAILADSPFGLHVHLAEAATPKDGPSAGAALTVAMFSVLKGIPVKNDIAMTGEIDMAGKITKIGGVKSKILGAKSRNIKQVFIPKDNANELERLLEEEPKLVDDSFDVKLVDNISQLLENSLAK